MQEATGVRGVVVVLTDGGCGRVKSERYTVKGTVGKVQWERNSA